MSVHGEGVDFSGGRDSAHIIHVGRVGGVTVFTDNQIAPGRHGNIVAGLKVSTMSTFIKQLQTRRRFFFAACAFEGAWLIAPDLSQLVRAAVGGGKKYFAL